MELLETMRPGAIWRSGPAWLFLPGGFVLGAALQLRQAELLSRGVYVTLLLLAVLGLAALIVLVRAGVRWPVLLLTLLLAVCAGFALTGWRAAVFLHSALEPRLEGRDLLLTGEVLAMPQASEDGQRFRFAVESAQLAGQAVHLPPRIYLGWYAGFGLRETSFGMPVIDLQRQPQTLRAGERWSFAVRLKAPHGNANPQGFDYELWLWEQGLQATGYVRAGPSDPAPQKLSDGWAHPIERARQAVREAIYARISDRQIAGILAALVVGDQNAIERGDWDMFRSTGVAHLVSISGLHITMFAWAASLLLAWLWRRSVRLTPRLCLWLPAVSAGAWGGLLLAIFYALFSGWGVPAQRTVCMLATVLLLRQAGGLWPWFQVWLMAMFAVVAVDPWALLQAGFWLSFVAVGILFASGTPRRAAEATLSWHRRVLAGLLHAAREQWLVSQFSLVGLLANALAIPWVTLLVTPLALLGVAWAPVWDLAGACVQLLMLVLRWFADWPFAAITVASAPPLFVLGGIAGGALLLLRLPWYWRLCGLPLLLPVLFWLPPRPAPGQFELLGADIGQGNAVIVRTAAHSLLYDSGPRLSRDSDAGHRVLVPLLRSTDERLDLLLLSHRDSDHTGGAPAVLGMQPQAKLLSSIAADHELQALRPATRCVAGQRWRWDGVDFEILHPLPVDYENALKPNALSCVLRISNGTQVALLAGDIEAPQEAALLRRLAGSATLHADFLLVPHHGSKTSSSAEFLDAVRPRFALAQSGYRNRFGHPAAEVVERYRQRGIGLVSSPACGAASWRSVSPQELRCERRQDLRYWRHQVADVS
jgi:competence protein ComEC